MKIRNVGEGSTSNNLRSLKWAVLLGMLISGCSQKADRSASEVEVGKVHVDIATMANHDSAFADMKANVSSLQDDMIFPAGSQLVVLMDNSCLDERKQSIVQSVSQMAMKLTVNAAQIKDLRIQAHAIHLIEAVSVSELANLADADDCVVGISNNVQFKAQAVPNDPGFGSQKYMKTINAGPAFDIFYSPAAGIKKETIVAVVDTGVDAKHIELQGRMWKNAQGFTGIDLVNNDNDPSDDHGHGTFVSGIIAAQGDNKIGMMGVAGKSAKIMAIKILDNNGAGDAALTINGINYAVQNGARVINISTSAPGSSPALQSAIDNAIKAGVTIVTAAGNDGKLVSSFDPKMPAIYGPMFLGMITVGSIDSETLQLSSFSNFGLESVELGAPGENGIVSLYPDDKQTEDAGTSFSSPQVAGAAALVVGLLESRGYASSPALVEKLIIESGAQNYFLAGMFIHSKHLDLAALGKLIDQRYPAQVVTPTPSPVAPTPAPTPQPTPASTPAPTPVSIGVKSVVARHSGKCLDIAGASSANAAPLIQWSCKVSGNQLFDFVSVGNDQFTLKVKHSGKCLDVSGGSVADGASLIQFDCHGGANQKFTLKNMGSGYYSLVSVKSGKCVDVAGPSTANNARLIQWTCHGKPNQQFQLK